MKNTNWKRLLKIVFVMIGFASVLVLGVTDNEKYIYISAFLVFEALMIRQLVHGKNGIRQIGMLAVNSAALFVLVLFFGQFRYETSYLSIWKILSKTVMHALLTCFLFGILRERKTVKKGAYASILKASLAITVSALYSVYAMVYVLKSDYFCTTVKAYVTDVILALFVLLMLWSLTGVYKLSCFVWICFLTMFGVVNHFILKFRGNPFLLSDLKAARTAKEVVGGYKITFNAEMLTTMLAVLVLLGILIQNISIADFRQSVTKRVLCIRAFVLVVSCIGFYRFNIIDMTDEVRVYAISQTAWSPMLGYENCGILRTIVDSRIFGRIEKPSGYSEDRLEEIYNRYSSETQAQEIQPQNIIVIMNESWADLSVIGDVKTNIGYQDYYDRMDTNVIKGYTYVPMYGGGTCNSEYEFLTGNSMWYTPGSYPYESVLKEYQPSLVSTLCDQGYETFAIHPSESYNWNREKVYAYLGFDHTMFIEDIEDGDYPELSYCRGLVSDEGLYDLISHVIETSASEKNFVFAVTIQNHGGYILDGYTGEVIYENSVSPEMDQYLSLLRESDTALEKLITYYSTAEQPTMIVMFGDHIPTIPDDVQPDLLGKPFQSCSAEEKTCLYQTPYFIWTNYETDTELDRITSLNFLSSIMLRRAGLNMPVYNRFLLDMSEVVPAMNVIGYFSGDGTYFRYNRADSETDLWLTNYKYLMYNQLKNPDKRDERLFRISEQ